MSAAAATSVGPTPTPTRTGTATPTPTRTGTATITPTPTRTPTSGPISGNTLYILDGAALGTTGALSFTAGGGAASDTIPTAGGGNYDGTPRNPLVYTITGVSGTYSSGQASAFSLFLDAGANVERIVVLLDPLVGVQRLAVSERPLPLAARLAGASGGTCWGGAGRHVGGPPGFVDAL